MSTTYNADGLGFSVTVYSGGPSGLEASLHLTAPGLSGLSLQELQRIREVLDQAIRHMGGGTCCCGVVHASITEASRCPQWGMNRP